LQFLNTLLSDFFNLVHGFVQLITDNPNYSYGIAIILFTIIIRVLLLPLNIKQTRSQAKMQEIQPEIKKLQEKYKNDPQKSQQEMMKLYKEHGANPMSGCLPLIIQMPVLFAMFYAFNHLPLDGVKFLWLPDLAQKDPLYILPILSTVTTYFSSLMITPKGDNPQAKQTSTMNTGMAIFMGFMSLSFKSALVMYWVINNLLQMAQTIGMRKMGLMGKPVSADKESTGVETSKQAVKEVSTDKVKSGDGNKKNKKK
jgi:YidC/Oxa1 family membrane protein insertase